MSKFTGDYLNMRFIVSLEFLDLMWDTLAQKSIAPIY
jgi:hypothetical protein